MHVLQPYESHPAFAFRDQEFLSSRQEDLYTRLTALLWTMVPGAGEVAFPPSHAPYAVRSAIAVMERERERRSHMGEASRKATSDALAVERARQIHSQLCAIHPRIKYWTADEAEVFDLLPSDLKLPPGPESANDAYEIGQQYGRIMAALDKTKEMSPAERRMAILERKVARLVARVAALEARQETGATGG